MGELQCLDAAGGNRIWSRNILTDTFSPRFFSETLVNYNFEGFETYWGSRTGNWSSQLGLPNPFVNAGFPEVRNVGLSYEWWAARDRNNRTGVMNVDENLTYVAGRHSLEFGGRFRKDRIHVLFDV